MTLVYIISQILALISFILSLFAYYRKKKKDIMLTMIFSNFLNLIHYVILDATSGYLTKILAIIRDFFVVIKEKYKWKSNFYLIFFVLVYIIIWVITYENIYSLLPLLAALIYIISIWNWNELIIKKSAFLTYFLWLIYNIFVWSIVAIIANVISIISSFIAILKHQDTTEKKYKKWLPNTDSHFW